MKVKEITVSRVIKIPVPGVAYSNQESSCSMTLSVGEEDDVKKIFREAWEEIKRQVQIGLDSEEPAWLREGKEGTYAASN